MPFVARRGLPCGKTGAAITLGWFGAIRTSRESSIPAAGTAFGEMVKKKRIRHTNGVKGILLNIPFLPALSIANVFNKQLPILSSKKLIYFSIYWVNLREVTRCI